MRQKLFYMLLIILMLTVFFQCSRDHSETLSSEMAKELALLPSSAAGLGYLNIKAAKESPFYSMVRRNLEENPFYSDDYQEFMEATGMDIREDIDELYFSINPEMEEEETELFLLIKGSYQPDKIVDYILKTAAIEDEEIVTEKYTQHTIYTLPDEDFSICFADDNRLIFGTSNQIKTWLDKFIKSTDTELETAVRERIRAIRHKNGGWLSVDTREIFPQIMEEIEHHARDGRFEALESLQNMNASVQFKEKMKFHGIGQFNDPEKAQLFHDALKGLIAGAKLSVSKDRKAVDVLNKIQTENKGKKIIVEFEMSKDDIEKLKQEREEVAVL
jgi:hypothetical protein